MGDLRAALYKHGAQKRSSRCPSDVRFSGKQDLMYIMGWIYLSAAGYRRFTASPVGFGLGPDLESLPLLPVSPVPPPHRPKTHTSC